LPVPPLDETDYWLELLKALDFIDDKSFQSINADCTDLLKLLTSSIKTAKKRHLSFNC